MTSKVPHNPRLDVSVKKYGIKNNLTNKFIENRPVQYASAFKKQPKSGSGKRFFNYNTVKINK
jgi:hypothetical protein